MILEIKNANQLTKELTQGALVGFHLESGKLDTKSIGFPFKLELNSDTKTFKLYTEPSQSNEISEIPAQAENSEKWYKSRPFKIFGISAILIIVIGFISCVC